MKFFLEIAILAISKTFRRLNAILSKQVVFAFSMGEKLSVTSLAISCL